MRLRFGICKSETLEETSGQFPDVFVATEPAKR